jgi:hypothetical protein
MVDPDDHVTYATRLRREGRDDDAVEHYERALALDEDHAPAHAGLAALRADEDRGTAVRHYRTAVALAPDDPEIRYDYGALLFDDGTFAAARDQLRRSVQLWLDHGQPAEALHDLDTLVRCDRALGEPTVARGRWRWAMWLLEETSVDPELDRRLRSLGTVLADRPLDRRVRDAVGLGLEHLARGEFERAIHLFGPAWTERSAVPRGSAARRRATEAGVAMAGFHRVAGNERQAAEILRSLDGTETATELPPGPAALYDHLTGRAGREPGDLRRLASADPEAVDCPTRLFAFADLLELLVEE